MARRLIGPKLSRGQKYVILQRSKVDQVFLALADAMLEAEREVVVAAAAVAPDSPLMPYPTGEGLPKQGGALVYFNGKKVGQWSIRGVDVKPPRAAHVSSSRGLLGIIGWGYPARWAELSIGTHPFFTPVANAMRGDIPARMSAAVRPRLRRLP